MQAQRIKAKVKRAKLENDRAFRDCEPDVVYNATINLDDTDDPDFGKECVLVDGCGEEVYCTTVDLEIVEKGKIYKTTYAELFRNF